MPAKLDDLSAGRLAARLLPALLTLLAWGCVPERTGAPDAAAVAIGSPVEKAPAWAEKELAAFAAMEACYQDFLKRFVGADGATVVTPACHHGTIDDVMEGFFKWDKFVLLAGSDDLRAKYLRIWKYHWKYGCDQGFFRDGFYWKGYDAEHAGELLPMLWACLELAPEDRELIATNRAVADVFLSERWFHPGRHLFRYSWMCTRPLSPEEEGKILPRWRGECGVNTVYSSGVWLAYLTTGEARYRQWVLDYCAAWNAAAAANGGVFPYHIDTETMKPGPGGDGRWWLGTEGGTASFDYVRYGIGTPSRGLRNLPVAAAFLDRGDARHAAGLVGTVKALYSSVEGGLAAGATDAETGRWVRGKWPHDTPALLDKAYVLTWDPALAKLMADYPADKVTWLERWIVEWFNFTYNRRGGLEQAEAVFERMRTRAEKRMAATAAAPAPKSGDDLTDLGLDKPWDLDYVDGAQWAGQNGRNGGPSPGSVGYFDAAGRRGLPPGVAALVRHVDRGSVTVLLYNGTAGPVDVGLTGGYYGQHRIDALDCAGTTRAVGQRTALVRLPARGLAEVSLRLTRCAYQPSLRPLDQRGG